jgi:hypothetical protein
MHRKQGAGASTDSRAGAGADSRAAMALAPILAQARAPPFLRKADILKE